MSLLFVYRLSRVRITSNDLQAATSAAEGRAHAARAGAVSHKRQHTLRRRRRNRRVASKRARAARADRILPTRHHAVQAVLLRNAGRRGDIHRGDAARLVVDVNVSDVVGERPRLGHQRLDCDVLEFNRDP
eukprot:COSAG06_NODE_19738_length_824_cov_1.984828_2_plen_131_part_00